MIEKERVEHIADLAKLYISEEEMPKYQTQLSDILKEIEKIQDVDISNEDIMISPCEEINNFSEDIIENHISKDDMLINAKRKKGDYITVTKVIE